MSDPGAASPWGRREPDPPSARDFRATRDIPYRLWRLRRIWVPAVALPVIEALVLAGAATGWQTPFVIGFDVALLLALWSALALTCTVAFPALALVEVLSGLAGTLAVLPLLSLTTGVSPTAKLLLVIPWLAAAVAAGVIVPVLVARLPNVPMTFRQDFRTKAAAETAFAALAFGPDRRWPGGDTGPADAEGAFEMRSVRLVLDVERRAMKAHVWSARMRPIETHVLAQSVLMTRTDGAQSRNAILSLVVTPEGEGSWVRSEERADRIPLGSAVGLWLTDATRDLACHKLDRLEGRPARSIAGLPLAGLVTWIIMHLPEPPGPGRF
jgi:hypothetical protein